MIIVILSLVLVLLCIVASISLQNYSTESFGMVCVVLVIIDGFITLALICMCISVHIPMHRNQTLTEYQQTYSVISQMIDNNDIAVTTLTSQIAEYNANVLKGRMMQDSILFSVLDYDFYYDLPLIELNSER